jgi:putative transposase
MWAARFGFNQCLALVKTGLDARKQDPAATVPWTGFDLINAFNNWKRSSAAGRTLVADTAGVTTVVATGLPGAPRSCSRRSRRLRST